jgi:uncharacterized radical SAM superfamily protein
MTDLSTLFARNPLDLTRDDISTIIEAFRKSRHQFNLGNVKAGSTKPPTEKQKKLNDLASKLDIKL